ncbi:MAG: pyridoxamine 5'-phosphate oxidase [Xanthomonadales bacterium]|nr:pyridoxamine 5'-phosphate oxidase [Xanthomonadales bacterium]
MLNTEILSRFNEAFDAAKGAGEPEPTAMVLATSDGDGNLSTRTVLLKGVDESGFVFYTNTLSIKGQQLRALPRASLTFLWKTTQCQVHASGSVTRVTEAEADAYFASRERESQIGAWASRQSEILESRQLLENRVAEFERKFEGRKVPRPPHWSGYRVVPEMVEFWHGRRFRLHDRFRYTLQDGAWVLNQLFP